MREPAPPITEKLPALGQFLGELDVEVTDGAIDSNTAFDERCRAFYSPSRPGRW